MKHARPLSTFPLTALVALAATGMTTIPRALALPTIEGGGVAMSVAEPGKQGSPVVLADDADPNLVYLPFDRIYLQELDDGTGRPQFGMVYDEKGGYLGFTVAAGYSKAALDLARSEKAAGKRVAPLIPKSGTWTMVVSQKDGTNLTIGATSKVETNLPSIPVPLATMLDAQSIAYVVNSYRTGAGIGAIYNYKYRATRTAFSFRANVHWNNVRRYVKEQNVETSGKCTSAGGGALIYSVFVGGSYKGCQTSTSNVRKITQALIERQDVKLIYTGTPTDDQKAAMIDEVAKLILHMTFKPTLQPSERLPGAEIPSTECEAKDPRPVGGVIPAAPVSVFASHCTRKGHNYVYDEEVLFEEKTYTYTIESRSIDDYDGAVGGLFGDMCKTRPDFFVKTDGTQGCPTVWANDGTGIKTHLNGGPQPVLPTGGSANGLTPALPGNPGVFPE